MKAELQKQLTEFKAQYDEFYTLVIGIDEAMHKNRVSAPDLADLGFLYRELENLADELRKHAKARKVLAEKLLGVYVITQGMDAELKVKGELCTATIDCKMEAILPKFGDPDWETLMRWCGVPEDHIKSGIVTPHWKRMNVLINERIASGQKNVPGVNDVRPKYTATFRRRHNEN